MDEKLLTQTQPTRLAVISMFVENANSIAKVNTLLHEFAQFIIGRLGIPCKEKDVSIICVVLNADATAINSLCGKLGMIDGVKAKTLFGKQSD